MALIKCPECGKEISDTCDQCIQCGYMLKNDKKTKSLDTRNSENVFLVVKNLVLNNKKKVSIIAALCILIIVAVLLLTGGYRYKRDGFVGLDKKITFEDQPETIEKLKIYGKKASGEDGLYTYEKIKLFEKYKGDLLVYMSQEDHTKMSTLSFKFEDGSKSKEIIASVTDTIGKPIHMENYNNNKQSLTRNIWRMDKNHYLTYEHNKEYDSAYLSVDLIDKEAIEDREKSLKVIKKDKKLKEEYDRINTRLEYVDLSIEDVISVFNAEHIGSAEREAEFSEENTLFNHKGSFIYTIINPEYEYFSSDFSGQVDGLRFRFEGLDDKGKKEVISKADKIFGKQADKEESQLAKWENAFSKCIAYENNEGEFSLTFYKNAEYCYIEPEFNSDSSTKEIVAYSDVDVSDFDFPRIYKSQSDISITEKYEVWDAAKEAVKLYLKSPSSAEFGSAAPASEDVKITRAGDLYIVKSWVDAQNSFGAQLRKNFTVTLSESYGTYKATFVDID